MELGSDNFDDDFLSGLDADQLATLDAPAFHPACSPSSSDLSLLVNPVESTALRSQNLRLSTSHPVDSVISPPKRGRPPLPRTEEQRAKEDRKRNRVAQAAAEGKTVSRGRPPDSPQTKARKESERAAEAQAIEDQLARRHGEKQAQVDVEIAQWYKVRPAESYFWTYPYLKFRTI